MTSSTVLAQTAGFDVSALRTLLTYHSPPLAAHDGCSLYAYGAAIHDTCGSVPLATSARSWLKRFVSYSLPPPDGSICVPLSAGASGSLAPRFWYCLKFRMTLSP